MGGIAKTDDDGISNARIWMPIMTEFRNTPELRKLREEDIVDKSKQDWLAKGFVLVQATWFVTQCIARQVQNIAVTELELTACAYALLSAVIYGFWWKKPFDVSQPITVSRTGAIGQKDTSGPLETDEDWFDQVGAVLGGNKDGEIDFDRRNRVPTFYSGTLSQNGIDISFLIVAVIATAFGAIHLIAWNFAFPTHTEQIMWRASALAVTAVPSLLAVLMFMTVLEIDVDGILGLAMLLSIPVYTIGRLILLAIALSSLRNVPPSALQVVNWTTFIPHIS
jgi:hypothetical protein